MISVASGTYLQIGIQNPVETSDLDLVLPSLDMSVDVPIYSEDGTLCLRTCLLSGEVGNIEVYQIQHNYMEWRYVAVRKESDVVLEVCFCPSSGIDQYLFPPTSAEILVVKAWAAGLIDLRDQKVGTVIIMKHGHSLISEKKSLKSLLALTNVGFCQKSSENYQSPNRLYNKYRSRAGVRQRTIRPSIWRPFT